MRITPVSAADRGLAALRGRCGFSLAAAALAALFATAAAAAASADRPLFDVAAPENLQQYLLSDCKTQIVRAGAGRALKLVFGHARPWPSIRLAPERLGYRTDWSGDCLLAVTVSNPTEQPVEVNIRVDSQAVKGRGRQGGAEIAPRQRARLLLDIGGRPPIIGMIGQPPISYVASDSDVRLHDNRLAFDSAHVTALQLFLARPTRDHAILVHRIALVPAASENSQRPFVDRFGQYNGADWPGKLHDEAELPERVRAEQRYFEAHPALADRDRYGGWLQGPQCEATGRFRTAKWRGKWWLVDPDGRLFWSHGVDCVRVDAATIVAGREPFFEWLPDESDPLARFYSGRGRGLKYDFFQADLFRKYGADYARRFFEVAMKRFRSWGVNTIGNWSSPDAWRLHDAPYTISVSATGGPTFAAYSRVKAGKEKQKWFPDVFDPRFRSGLEKRLAQYAEFKDDPWLLGVFIHNELPWTLGAPWRGGRVAPTGIGLLCLERNDATFTAKRVLLSRLREKHRSIDELNRVWGTQFGGWSELERPFSLTDAQRKDARADLTALDALVAAQYFRVCREAMNTKMPGVLYLGCRFGGAYDKDCVEAAGRYCDAVSFNIYAEHPSERTADELASELDFPVLIGEFHFGALDRGMFHPGLRRAKDQQERAALYARYIREAAAAPWCIGAHWFQYVDQPLTGRSDGENYNIGFVDATDDPYPEMRDAARKLNEHLYQIRSGRPD